MLAKNIIGKLLKKNQILSRAMSSQLREAAAMDSGVQQKD
jgi:hypothetical protein